MPKNPKIESLRLLRAEESNHYGAAARELQITYGLIRGHSMAQIEAEGSDPHRFPSVDRLLTLAGRFYPGEDPMEFLASLRVALMDWKKQLAVRWVSTVARRRARNAAKRATPRIHPRRAEVA